MRQIRKMPCFKDKGNISSSDTVVESGAELVNSYSYNDSYSFYFHSISLSLQFKEPHTLSAALIQVDEADCSKVGTAKKKLKEI